jgi:hypothetical protein
VVAKRTCCVDTVNKNVAVLDVFSQFSHHAASTIRRRVDRDELVRLGHFVEAI